MNPLIEIALDLSKSLKNKLFVVLQRSVIYAPSKDNILLTVSFIGEHL